MMGIFVWPIKKKKNQTLDSLKIDILWVGYIGFQEFTLKNMG